MENIIDLCKSEGIELDDMISCSFKAYSFEWRKFSLGLTNVLAHGVENYRRFKGEVDLDYEKNHHFGTVGGADSDYIDMEAEYDDL